MELLALTDERLGDEFDHYSSKLDDLRQEWRKYSRMHRPGIFPRTPFRNELFKTAPLTVNFKLKPIKNDGSDEIVGWTETVDVSTAKTEDLTMKRAPLPSQLTVRGNPSRLPFLSSTFLEDKKNTIKFNETESSATFLGEPLLTRMTSMDIGIDFDEDDSDVLLDVNDIDHDTSFDDNAASDILTDSETQSIDIWDNEDSMVLKNKSNEKPNNKEKSLEDSIMEPLSNGMVLNISNHQIKKQVATEWVEILDTTKPVDDFEQRIPNMAHKFPFELDTFQKLAILKLEEQGHVFVAAHTSAGKTVVAEYAIALALKHCTRIIYTSPVKALSNQKYREFTRAFGDVGLITGDIQINTTASCLVMTTEILRSMLYYGSDVIRDLEYVIFDEVHYINDTQRGYVWEEVLILLPPHCGIVMLSATVPNTLEFADWVGRIKKRMVYVVSTTKRPVPLCHYLYLSPNSSRVAIVDLNGKFLHSGYESATQVYMKSKMSNQKFGPNHKGRGGGNSNYQSKGQNKHMWIGLIQYLDKHDKLPVVAFVLSRKRCDDTANSLSTLNMTTAKEKSRIHMFYETCLKKLSESDRELPQVTMMQALLKAGIGIHHSGILPILKEVVEMLFQLGLVKILFATETFAVGVNMPARTVVFDSITKYDGFNWRSLLPSEYIQMAGRAGRRGLDETGTVMVLCKKDLPSKEDLVNMMLGKPSKLSSQFRITYATMLSLLRVTNLSIESMMKASFREFGAQTKTSTHKIEMQKLYDTLTKTAKTANYEYLGKFCDLAYAYFNEMTDVMNVILAQKTKELSIGKVVLVNFDKYVYQYGIILDITGQRKGDYHVLLLEFNPDYYFTPPNIQNKTLWYAMMHFAGWKENAVYQYRIPYHTIVTIQLKNIIDIFAEFKFKGNCSSVEDDYAKRVILKAAAPPNQNCINAVKYLYEITFAMRSKTFLETNLTNYRKKIKIKQGEIFDSIKKSEDYRKSLLLMNEQCRNQNLYNEFPLVFARKELEWKYNELVRLLSNEEMTLYPEYQRRLEVLKELGYIDAQNHVAIKGRVACELGKNELMITEIVFRSILTELDPPEIAALLSCLVVEARIQLNNPQEFSAKLEEKIQEILYIDEDLTKLESKYQVGSDDPLAQNDRLNFGLVEVIYDWARGRSFCDIMAKTEVQEGVIVHSIQKLHEILMNVRDVAKIIGDPILQTKMDEASVAIKRDIVFAVSLYTQDDISNNFIGT